MTRKTKLVLGIVLILLAMGYLMLTAFSKGSGYYLTIQELLDQANKLQNKPVKVSGLIVGSSVQWDPGQVVLKFNITEDNYTLPVIYHGPKPNDFTDGKGVIVEGKYGKDGVLRADKLLMTCPSKYEAKPR